MSVALPPSGVGQDVAAQPDVRPIHRLIAGTRRLLRFSQVLSGLGLTVGTLVSLAIMVAALDILLPASPERWQTRLAGLLVVAVPPAVGFVAWVLWPLLRPWPAEQVARRIEQKIPNIHNRLLSSLDLAARHGSSAFYQRLLREAVERSRDFRPFSVADKGRLRRSGHFAGAGAVVFVFAWLVLGSRLQVALARVVSPFDDIPPATGVFFAVEPGDTKILRGDDIPFLVRVEQGQPSELVLEIRSPATGQRLSYELEQSKDDARLWTCALGSGNIGAGFEDGFRYRILGGGTWSRLHSVALLDRPVIMRLDVTLRPPDYLQQGPQIVSDALSGCAGSRVELAAAVQDPRRVAAGDVVLGDPYWVNGKVPAGAAAEGRWQWDGNVEGRPAHTEPPLAGVHAHWFRDDPAGFPVEAGETLFADVFIPAQQPPRAVMLQWHDGTSWEHRAIWGEDHFPEGKPGTPSRLRVGPLPETGRWVRLQVAVDELGLGGRRLRGLAFALDGGQAYWGRVGVVPLQTHFPMQRRGDDWVGSLPLERSGSYRVELRNELGHANLAMQPRPFVALPDQPPQVLLKRPGPELIRSEPGPVLLEIEVVDDFALAELAVVAKRGDKGEPVRDVIKTYPPFLPTEKEKRHADFVQYDLDLAELGLKVGDVLRYSVEARDRKGQAARTPEAVIRLQPGPNSAEERLAAFDKGQELFQHKLAQLVAAQAEVRDKVAQLAKKDVVTAQELQQEMARLSRQQQMNAKAAELLRQDMAWSAEQLSQLPNLPGQLAEQMRTAQRLFEETAIPGLKILAEQMSRGADQLRFSALHKQCDLLQKELQAIQDRVSAISAARKKAVADRDQALADLTRVVQQQDAARVGRELEELRKHVAGVRDDLEELQKNLESSAEAEKKQGDLDQDIEKALAAARDLRDGEKTPRTTNPIRGGEEEQEAAGNRLGKRQQRNLKDLEQARQGLSAEEQDLEQIAKHLKGDAEGDLKKLLQSAALKKALAKARQVKGQGTGAQASPRNGSGSGNLQGTPPSADVEVKLANLDPRRRGLMLKMPPRLREELLQGLEEKGPEGYQKFIDDYFRKLTEESGGVRGGR